MVHFGQAHGFLPEFLVIPCHYCYFNLPRFEISWCPPPMLHFGQVHGFLPEFLVIPCRFCYFNLTRFEICPPPHGALWAGLWFLTWIFDCLLSLLLLQSHKVWNSCPPPMVHFWSGPWLLAWIFDSPLSLQLLQSHKVWNLPLPPWYTLDRPMVSYLNFWLSLVTTATSISEGLKSADNTDDKHLIAV